jgi:hypothetical protein
MLDGQYAPEGWHLGILQGWGHPAPTGNDDFAFCLQHGAFD